MSKHSCPGEPGFECSDTHYAKGLCQRCYRRIHARNSNHYEQNKERILDDRRRYRREHKARILEDARRYYEAHKDEQIARNHLRRARERDALYIPFTQAKLTDRLSMFGFRCWMCGTDEADTVDHVIPIARGGPHCLSNLRPACRSCNISKGTKHWSEL